MYRLSPARVRAAQRGRRGEQGRRLGDRPVLRPREPPPRGGGAGLGPASRAAARRVRAVFGARTVRGPAGDRGAGAHARHRRRVRSLRRMPTDRSAVQGRRRDRGGALRFGKRLGAQRPAGGRTAARRRGDDQRGYRAAGRRDDRACLLQHDQLVSGARRYSARVRVDRTGIGVFGPPRHGRLPGRLPYASRGDHAVARRLGRRGVGAARGDDRARTLGPRPRRSSVVRVGRDRAPARRPSSRGRRVRAFRRLRQGSAAGPGDAPRGGR